MKAFPKTRIGESYFLMKNSKFLNLTIHLKIKNQSTLVSMSKDHKIKIIVGILGLRFGQTFHLEHLTSITISHPSKRPLGC
jgi:hypothetical protein